MSYQPRIIDHGPDHADDGHPERYTLARVDEWDDGTFTVRQEWPRPSWWLLRESECDGLDDILDGRMRL